jgi:hypothetical protein
MKLRSRYCTRPDDRSGDYAFFAEAPGPAWIEVTEPVQVAKWTRGFTDWILETWEHIRRAEAKRPRLIDWHASPEKMRAHLKTLQREMRTDDRPRLFRRPLTAAEDAE